MGWTIGVLAVLAIGTVWLGLRLRSGVRSAVASDRAITAAIDQLSADPPALLQAMLERSPPDFDRWLRDRLAAELSDANAIEEAWRELLTHLSQRLCKRCVETWVNTRGASTGPVFAVHDYMRDYDLAEAVANSGIYEALDADQRAALESMPEDDRLDGSMRHTARQLLGDAGRVRRLGAVDTPVAADVYGRVDAD